MFDKELIQELFLFTDGSVNTKTKVGCGACLFTSNTSIPIDELKGKIQIVFFENTSSTKLEIENLLWALNQIKHFPVNLTVYTDSQNIVHLPERRKKLEQKQYFSNQGKLINSHNLYKEFYRLTDELNCKFIKVEGHKSTSNKDFIDNIFTLVDRASRNALRNFNAR